jgi:glutamyl-tRNA synthetase
MTGPLAGREAVVGRLAPSPTGRLHLGHARTFLLAWWHARSRGGRIVMRMEDLDAPRVVPGTADAILRDLEWLGLDWDGPVVMQSANLEQISAAAAELVERGLAYPCICTRGDVQRAQSAPQAGVAEVRYPGTCRGRFASVAEAERASGQPAGLRFQVPAGVVRLTDGIAGSFATDVSAETGDFLVARRGGAPAYQLAAVVDDAAEGVTEVVRGDDLLPSTARQHLLQRALHLPHPATWHVPLVVDGEGRRLAKRSDDLSLAELRDRGTDAREIVGWVARSAGIPDADRPTASEVTAAFDMSRIPRAPVGLTDLASAVILGGSRPSG